MHPLLAASLINSFSTERVAAAKTRRVAKAARTADADESAEVVIRRARSADAPELSRLAALDGNHRAGRRLLVAAEAHTVLVAEVDGELEAALDIDRGLSVANPFRPSAPHQQLLLLRARQLGGSAPRHSRRARPGVLSPRRS